MKAVKTLEKLELQLNQLVDNMMTGRNEQVDFLIGLNRLDDILIDLNDKRPVMEPLTRFLSEYRHWLNEGFLEAGQKKRLGQFFGPLVEGLLEQGDSGHFKLAEEIKEWSQKLGTGSFRLTLKSSGEQASLADRFYSLLRREAEEMNILLEERGHLLTCLDDILFMAENREDKIYHHLAASLIYFLRLEGYRVDPYLKRLRKIQEKI